MDRVGRCGAWCALIREAHPLAEEELVVNIDSLSREKLALQDGDIVEIYQPEDRDATTRWGSTSCV